MKWTTKNVAQVMMTITTDEDTEDRRNNPVGFTLDDARVAPSSLEGQD
jgi:hypothetical protein